MDIYIELEKIMLNILLLLELYVYLFMQYYKTYSEYIIFLVIVVALLHFDEYFWTTSRWYY